MGDLISRQIIKAQMMKYGFRAPDMTITEFVEDCLPSARPEDQRGEWKECGTITIEGYRAYVKECSKCHSAIIGGGNFCPVCGADMRGEDEDVILGK